MRKTIIIPGIALILASCASNPVPRDGLPVSCTFAVVSDVHLAIPGSPTFPISDTPAGNPGMLAESVTIFEETVFFLLREHPDFLVITGDLTDAGDEGSVREAVRILSRLTDAGIPVFLVPGTRDARGYSRPFRDVFYDFGYSAAFAEDPHSLSYALSPVPGIVLCIGDSLSKNKAGEALSRGAFDPRTVDWLSDRMGEATRNGSIPLFFTHYGLVEHFKGETFWLPDFIVKDADAFLPRLARAGLKAVFSGYGHATDATAKDTGYGTITDIETGSLSVWPFPVRIVTVRDGTAFIRTERPIESALGAEFMERGKDHMRKELLFKVENAIRRRWKDESDIAWLGKVGMEAVVSHVPGDETYREAPVPEPGRLSVPCAVLYEGVKPVLEALYRDLPPGDRECEIVLR